MSVERGPSPTRVALMHLRIGALNEMQYRANFWVQLGNSAIALVTGLIAISLVYNQTTSLGGWSQPELLALMGIHIMIGGVIRTIIQPNTVRLLEDVQEGQLDYALVRPIDSQLLVSVRQISFWNLIDVALGLGVVFWATTDMTATLGVGDVLAFMVTAFCGIVLMYCLWMIMATVAFKLIDIYQMVQVLHGIFDAARWPVSIYPGWLRGTLTFLIPLAFAVTVPAAAVSSRLDWRLLVAAVVITALVSWLTRWLWKRSLRSYSGASS